MRLKQPLSCFSRQLSRLKQQFSGLREQLPTLDWQAVALYPTRNQEPTDTQPYRALLNSSQVQRIYLESISQYNVFVGANNSGTICTSSYKC